MTFLKNYDILSKKQRRKEFPMAYKYSYDAYDDEVREYKPAPLKTDRCMWKLLLFSILTLGIYSIIFFIPFSFDIDKVSSRHDGEKTMKSRFSFTSTTSFGFSPFNIATVRLRSWQ